MWLAGVVNPEILDRLEADSLDSAFVAASVCPILEIRYDLFLDRTLWTGLAARLQGLFPSATLVGTIRMVCDGGLYPNQAFEKRALNWKRIIADIAPPQWIDLELSDMDANAPVLAMAKEHGIKVLGSRHDFKGVPLLEQLRTDVALAQKLGLQGFKIAAMSQVQGDCEALYQIARESQGSFEWFSAFAMGPTGQASRLFSFACGANISYASLGAAVAPGQITAQKMTLLFPRVSQAKSESEILNWL